jgi:predicted aspartyl protease
VTLFIAFVALTAMAWAVPSAGAAHFAAAIRDDRRNSAASLPARFRINKERGLLLDIWLNGRGPYLFAIDTGAGMNVVTERVAGDAGLAIKNGNVTILGGLSSARSTSNREAVIKQLALGDSANVLRGTKSALVVSLLAPGIDGILDPTDVYAPYGYSIDMPNQLIDVLDRTPGGLQRRQSTTEGAIVPWLQLGDSLRPFVRLGDGRLALVDTGSGFGLAVNERDSIILGNSRGDRAREGARDIAGGAIGSQRVSPTTISIGELVLRRVPTDILHGVDDDAPVILGRDVLYPFKITFDPERRLIEFMTTQKSGEKLN